MNDIQAEKLARSIEDIFGFTVTDDQIMHIGDVIEGMDDDLLDNDREEFLRLNAERAVREARAKGVTTEEWLNDLIDDFVAEFGYASDNFRATREYYLENKDSLENLPY